MKKEDFYKLGISKGLSVYNNYNKLGRKIEKAYGTEAYHEYLRGVLRFLSITYENEKEYTKIKK